MKPVLKFVCLLLCTCDKDQLMLQTSMHVCNAWILQCAAWSIIDSTKFMRGMDNNCQIREIGTSAYMLSNSIQPFVHQPANDFQTGKPNRTMTSERAVSFVRTIAWHVNVVIVTSPPENPHRKRKTFFSMSTRRLAESVEGLNSSLALVAGDLWPKKGRLIAVVKGLKRLFE